MPPYKLPKFTYKPNYDIPQYSSSRYAKEVARKLKEDERLEQLRKEEELRRLEEYLLQGRRSGSLPTRSARRKDELAYVSPFARPPRFDNQYVYTPSTVSQYAPRMVKNKKKRSAK
jgi:hypothetical protein